MARQGSKRTVYVYAHWKGMPEPMCMGCLYSERLRGNEVFSFEYDMDWLKRGPSQLLDPGLQLYPGLQYQHGEQKNFGIFLDSSPDRWGRTLMRRREAALARLENRTEEKLLDLLGLRYDGRRSK